MNKIGKFFKHNWIRLLVGLVIGLTFGAIFISVNGDWNSLRSYSDGIMLGGGVTFFFGLLVFVGGQGTFNALSFYPNRKKKDNGYKENYAEYTKRKEMERKGNTWNFLPYSLMGLLLIGVGALLLAFVK